MPGAVGPEGTPYRPARSVGPKYTKEQREEAISQVALLERRGLHQRAIATYLGLSQGMVSQYLRVIRRRYADAMMSLRETEVEVARKVCQYRDIAIEAYHAWERSKEDAVKVVEWVGSTASATTTTTEGQCGDPSYLRIIQECWRAERELLGLDPVRDRGKGGMGDAPEVDWVMLVGRVRDVSPTVAHGGSTVPLLEGLPGASPSLPEVVVPDTVEAEIASMLGAAQQPVEGHKHGESPMGLKELGNGSATPPPQKNGEAR